MTPGWIVYEPGQGGPTRESNRLYTAYQSALWDAYADVWYARAYGFESTRQPCPGQPLSERFTHWRERALSHAMSQQLYSSQMPKGEAVQSDLPENMWRYWYQRCQAAEEQR